MLLGELRDSLLTELRACGF